MTHPPIVWNVTPVDRAAFPCTFLRGNFLESAAVLVHHGRRGVASAERGPPEGNEHAQYVNKFTCSRASTMSLLMHSTGSRLLGGASEPSSFLHTRGSRITCTGTGARHRRRERNVPQQIKIKINNIDDETSSAIVSTRDAGEAQREKAFGFQGAPGRDAVVGRSRRPRHIRRENACHHRLGEEIGKSTRHSLESCRTNFSACTGLLSMFRKTALTVSHRHVSGCSLNTPREQQVPTRTW